MNATWGVTVHISIVDPVGTLFAYYLEFYEYFHVLLHHLSNYIFYLWKAGAIATTTLKKNCLSVPDNSVLHRNAKKKKKKC